MISIFNSETILYLFVFASLTMLMIIYLGILAALLLYFLFIRSILLRFFVEASICKFEHVGFPIFDNIAALIRKLVIAIPIFYVVAGFLFGIW